ncbi:hypothetical protein KR059_003557 [Drosophila kikkawai]|nr:hypothetical protein KR059_003557 [Drosophila kikkawai]
MREALFSQDGWGCQHVNQDTNWEVPSSPEPTNKDATGGPPMWKPSINNGTDLWESNLRNGGQPTAQQVPKPSWGHTPSSNLGGTWGEDDDGADSSSVWTGGSSGINNVSGSGPTIGQVVNQGGGGGGVNVGSSGVVVSSGGPPQWGQNVIGVGLGAGGIGSGNLAGTPAGVVPGNGGSNATNTGNGWGDPREIRPLPGGGGGGNSAGAGSMDIRSVVVDHRGGNGSGGGGASSNDPRDIRMIVDPMRDPIRGDPRGISGRLNGTSEMWGHHAQISHSQNMQNLNKMAAPAGVGTTAAGGGPGTNSVSSNIATQWGPPTQGVGVVKDISKQISGWEEPSPPPQRRSIPNYDDGTSLWGQQQQQQGRVVTAAASGVGGHWKDMTDSIGGRGNHLMRGNVPTVGANPMTNVGGPQSRLAAQHKPEGNNMWMQGGGVRNPPGVVTNTWGDDGHGATSSVSSGNNWSDEKGNQSWSDWGSNNKPSKASASGWSGAGVGSIDGVVELGNDWNPHGVGVGGIIGKTQQQQKLVGMVNVINSDMIKQSKQYRILVENGFKKEDVERALITANMNIEEAADMLRIGTSSSSSLVMDGWRRQQQHDDGLVGSAYSDHSGSATGGSGGGGFAGRYPVVGSGGQQPSMGFSHNNPMNNMGNTVVTGGGNNNANNMTALQVQKYLNQGGGPLVPQSVVGNAVSSVVSVGFGGQQNTSSAAGVVGGAGVGVGAGAGAGVAPVNITSANTNNQQPSGQQIRMLGQQIQLAIHSGFISSQILTQPLTQATLNLLNQLLSNIKHLQAAQQSLARGGNANPMAVNVAISKYKQQIQNLQNQINAQQAVYVKQQQLQQQNMQPNSQQQQQQQQHPSAHLNTSNNDYLRNHDAINNLQSNFTELNINKPSGGYQGASNQQSRLNQWKLPVLDKDIIINPDSSDFSRAPGATKQNLTSNSSNVSSLGLQNDGTWSTGRNIADGWPDPTSDNENKDWSVVAHQQPSSAAAAAAATAYTDLVQEFEPGKPWKGSQIKSIEDDPSITPGSVARSPLSINPTPKDADNILFNNTTTTTTGKNSPTDLPPLSLSSSTWSFNPNQNFPSWSDNTQQCAATSELWTSPLNKSSSRGPPPGLTVATNKSGNGGGSTTSTPSSTANGWLQQTPRSGGGTAVQTSNTSWTSASSNTSAWGSSWLLLKNLTAQIDGPTLRTLCMQHGPLVSFHLYLNQGIALCKYTTREEANKAQMALNNCVLANTTIFAESPSDNEVQNIMQHLPQQQGTSSSVNSSVGSNTSTSAPSNSSSASSNGNGNTGSGNGNSSNSGNGASVSNSNSNSSVNNSNLLNSAAGGGGNVSNASSITSTVTSSANAANNGGGTLGSGTTVSGSKNSGNASSNVVNSSSTTNNSQWRQTSQNQATRPSGREADFDYVSLVYSIVDD